MNTQGCTVKCFNRLCVLTLICAVALQDEQVTLVTVSKPYSTCTDNDNSRGAVTGSGQVLERAGLTCRGLSLVQAWSRRRLKRSTNLHQ